MCNILDETNKKIYCKIKIRHNIMDNVYHMNIKN